MSSLYIHIPFCYTKCPYCNFTSVASLKYVEPYVEALIDEISLRHDFFDTSAALQTIYFGGGTPSMLSVGLLEKILGHVSKTFRLELNNEQTIEINPEDAQPAYLKHLLSLGFNRLSIGIQSLNDDDLQFLGRKHSSHEAFSAICAAQDAGFQNLSVDIIIGLPTQTAASLERMLHQLIEHNIPHISAYLLTIEEPSFFDRWLKQGKMQLPDVDQWQVEAFYLCRRLLLSAGFEHYEISNYALPGFRSQHNSAYWQWKPYLGLGVSAHSFNLIWRQWNCNSITEYITTIQNGTYAPHIEHLTPSTAYNDYVLTHIRTIWGVDSKALEQLFGTHYQQYFQQKAEELFQAQLLEKTDTTRWILTEKALIVADSVTQQLMI